MTTDEIKARLVEIQAEIEETLETRTRYSTEMVLKVGMEDNHGINLDELSNWARQIKRLNTRLQELGDERRLMRAEKKKITPACTCVCH